MFFLYIKRSLLLILCFAFFSATDANPREGKAKRAGIKWAINKASSLTILGSTNVNTFGCDIIGYNHPDTINVTEEGMNQVVSLHGDLVIDISRFDCHNRMLTNDLRKTLKADQYPALVIRFLSLDRFPVISNNKDFMKGVVELELAGTCKRFEVCYSFVQTASNYIQLTGSRHFSFSDFNLTPPNKMAGLIKVRDSFSVDFKLLLSSVE